MKDINAVFTERINDIQDNLKDGNYQVCNRIAHDLINLAWNLELKDEVFISEVLETIFDNLNDSIDEYDVPKEKEIEIRDQLIKTIQPLKDAYKGKNAMVLYNTLKEMRYCATLHQLTIWQKYKSKKRHGYFAESMK